MWDMFFELGKSFLNLANMLFVIIFVKQFFESNNSFYLYLGAIIFLSLYIFGNILLFIARRRIL